MNKSEQIKHKVMERYKLESDKSCNLSCASNLDFLDLKPGEKILDLGCGKGFETIQAARLIGDTGKAVGLDLTAQMVEKAKENSALEGITNTEFIVGEIEKLPFGKESFDCVMSNCVINHAKDKFKVYKEIHRVLKPNGRFVISDAVTRFPLPDRIKSDPEQWASCFGGAVTEGEYMENIVKAGFTCFKILKRREYMKNGYEFISLTIKAFKF